ncbi:MAG TPA: PHP domain-containing protein [Candidatus Dormibacteraeota bacterium]|jgi:DNA polymerase (family 10)|nr:PHP domain-containing protein [Candidatus Dormibacteraeota bacterium]
MRNDQYAALLNRVADLLEIRGEVFFKVRSYREAARQVEQLSEPLDVVRADGRLAEVHGIGKAIADKINEYGDTGKLGYLEKLESEVPPGLIDFLRIPGLGPRTAKDIYDALGVTTLEGLEAALQDGSIRKVARIRAKTEENIAKGIEALRGRGSGPRTLLPKAMAAADAMVKALEGLPDVEQVSPAGSVRRRRESIGDIDLVVASTNPAPVMTAFCELGYVDEVIARGETKSSIRTQDGLQVDLRVVPLEHYGAALVYFTGSKAHNVHMRALALKQGLTLNEYGLATLAPADAEAEEAAVEAEAEAVGANVAAVARSKAKTPMAERRSRAVLAATEASPSATEEQVYSALGLAYIPPVLREDRGEIEAADEAKLPPLLQLDMIRGDLHAHTNNSDGKNTIEEMAEGAVKRGYGYLNITDHSRSQGIITGIEGSVYRDQVARVRAAAKALQKKHRGFRVLAGVEVNILPNGDLDVPEHILAELDVVVASVHSQLRQPREEMTARLVKAALSPHVDIIGHPTGRKVEARDPADVDMEALIKAAAKGHTALEINASPARLDLNDMYARRAAELGVKISINSDAHTPRELDQMEFGVYVAQRAWLQADDVINTWEVDRVLAWAGGKG